MVNYSLEFFNYNLQAGEKGGIIKYSMEKGKTYFDQLCLFI